MQIFKVDVHGMPDAGRRLDEEDVDAPQSGWKLVYWPRNHQDPRKVRDSPGSF